MLKKPKVAGEATALLSLPQIDEELQELEIGYKLLEKEVVHDKTADFADGLQAVHQVVDQKRRHLEFDVGDFVWAELEKNHFSVSEYGKQSTKKIGLVEVIEKFECFSFEDALPCSYCRCV